MPELRAALATASLLAVLGCGGGTDDSANTSGQSASTADPPSTSTPTTGATAAEPTTTTSSTTTTTGTTGTATGSSTEDATASSTGEPALPGCPLDQGATAALQGSSSLGSLDGFAFAWWTDKYFADEQGWRPVLFVFADPSAFAAAAVAGEQQGLFVPPEPYLSLDTHMADVPEWIGAFPVTAVQTAPDDVSGAGTLEITAIDWPPESFLPDAQPVLTGSVQIADAEDGFFLSGTFAAPYCAHLRSPPAP